MGKVRSKRKQGQPKQKQHSTKKKLLYVVKKLCHWTTRKRLLLKAYVWIIGLYGCKTWTIGKEDKITEKGLTRKVKAHDKQIQRRILGPIKNEGECRKRTNNDLYNFTKTLTYVEWKRQLNFLCLSRG